MSRAARTASVALRAAWARRFDSSSSSKSIACKSAASCDAIETGAACGCGCCGPPGGAADAVSSDSSASAVLSLLPTKWLYSSVCVMRKLSLRAWRFASRISSSFRAFSRASFSAFLRKSRSSRSLRFQYRSSSRITLRARSWMSLVDLLLRAAPRRASRCTTDDRRRQYMALLVALATTVRYTFGISRFAMVVHTRSCASPSRAARRAPRGMVPRTSPVLGSISSGISSADATASPAASSVSSSACPSAARSSRSSVVSVYRPLASFLLHFPPGRSASVSSSSISMSSDSCFCTRWARARFCASRRRRSYDRQSRLVTKCCVSFIHAANASAS